LIDYDETKYEERQIEHIEECLPCDITSGVRWINVDGLHDVDVIEKLGNQFNLHPLTLEDILHAGQRPKMEDLESHLFVVVMAFSRNGTGDRIESEQISIVLGANWLISFQEKEGDTFGMIRDRIRTAKGRIRRMGADYLAYSLIDSVVDNYFGILEWYGERIEDIEEALAIHPRQDSLQAIHHLKKEIILLRKSVWPMREVISGMDRSESPLVSDSVSVYLRDLYDHTIQVMDSVETYQNILSALLDLYLSSVNNKMNEVMKVLTVFASIFIPLTFLVGVYGMNFQYMPELAWRWGYPALWVFMISVIVGMVIYFKRKKWW
jgi:magnesium transporter